MSEFDSQDENEYSEEEEEERSRKSTLTDVKKEVRSVVANRKKGMLAEGETGKVKLTEEDVDRLFEKFPNITQEAVGNTPTMLHAIIELVRSDDDENIDSVTVKALVYRLVRQSTHLLCVVNEDKENPLYLAITKKRRILADYMVVSCPQEDSKRRNLADAIEDSRGNPERKNCLHLALEKDMKQSTLLRMVKEASDKALEAVDITGRRPMHYAVQYQHCNIKVIRAFINKDNEMVERQKQEFPRQPTKTFLDVDEMKTMTSVYEELVSSAQVHHEEHNSKKETLDHKKKKELSTSNSNERGRQVREQGEDAVKGRNAATQSKPESKFDHKDDNRSAIRPDNAGSAGYRDSRTTQDQARRPKDRGRENARIDNDELAERERLRELGKQKEASTRQDQERFATRRDISTSRDEQSLGPPMNRDSLRVQTTFNSAALTKPGNENTANTPKLLKRVPTMIGGITEDKPEKKVKQGATGAKKSSKHIDHETAERVSQTASRMLKLHYMRTRNIERATWWLHKTNPQDVQTFFDYHELPSELKEAHFTKAFEVTKFDEFLKFVHFTNVTVIRRQKASSKNQPQKGGLGRRDMEFFFDFLYKKGVRHILKVSVEEGEQSVHSDEAIQNALNRMTVEHLDWRKVDLDPQLICGISSQAENGLDGNENETSSRNWLRQLDLHWSGNTAVLRAWSEPEALPSLPSLETINIIVPGNTVLYDSSTWIRRKKDEFEERLNKHIVVASDTQQESRVLFSDPGHRKVVVNLLGLESATGKQVAVGSTQSGPTHGPSSETAPQRIVNTHEWLKCMDAFAKNMNTLWTSTRANFLTSIGLASSGLNQVTASRRESPENEVVVALIDDGVSLLDQNFDGRVLGGKTFDYREGAVGQSYISAQGHGTEMAKCILRVCPMAKIYPIRLKTHVSSEGTSQIDLESAALAIRAALEKNASIISMSWTIPVPEQHPAKARFEKAVHEAAKRNVLMFCSSPDGGQFKTKNYPSAVDREKLFMIGAAHDHGLAFDYTGDDVDFIFPGVKVNINPISPTTGSSVATALAAGLAATIIYCFKISALAVKMQNQSMGFNKISQAGFTESALVKIWQHETMKTALKNIGWVNKEGFIQIWDKFQPAVDKLESPDKADDHDYKVQTVMNLCNQLVVLQA